MNPALASAAVPMASKAVRIVTALVGVAVLVLCALAGGAPAVATNDPSGTATSTIPASLLSLFETVADTSSCGLAWTLLAAVAHTESDFQPAVVSSAGAEGLFQFEPATFGAYDNPVPPGGAQPPSPFDPIDATYAAARYLCSLGAAQDATSALVAYNCGNPGPACQAVSASYAAQVLATAATYTAPVAPRSTGGDGPNGVQAAALSYAEAQIGTPYVWGGETSGVGFDCSGLVQAAYAASGIELPRVAQDQYDAGPHLPAGSALEPGDLVFFGGGPHDVSHVGMVVDPSGVMVDAPYTGADVRLDRFPTSVGQSWGSDAYVGATRP